MGQIINRIFKNILNKIITIITYFHTKILSLNDNYELYLSDKQLHFYVVALLGLLLLLCLYPLFLYLVKRKKTLYITWFYVFTFLLAFTSLIEVGQKLTGTGEMDYMDTLAGILGFIGVSIIVFVIRWIYLLIRRFIGGKRDD